MPVLLELKIEILAGSELNKISKRSCIPYLK